MAKNSSLEKIDIESIVKDRGRARTPWRVQSLDQRGGLRSHDQEVAGRPRPGVPECVGDAVGEENARARARVEFSTSALEAESTRENVPCLVLGAMPVERNATLRVRPLFDLLEDEIRRCRSERLLPQWAPDVLSSCHSKGITPNLVKPKTASTRPRAPMRRTA